MMILYKERIMKNFFKNWNYKKHAAVVTGVYLTLYAVDMTLGYIVAKKCLNNGKDKENTVEIES